MHAPTTVDADLTDMMSAVFSDHRERNGPEDGIATCDPSLWAQLDELGLVRLTGREETGGSGAGWYEAAELLRAAASHGVRIPLAEHDLLAGWLLEEAGLPMDKARLTACVLDEKGVARGVPWASQADKIVTVWRKNDTYVVADLESTFFDITSGSNLADEPRDVVSADTIALSGTPVSDAAIRQLFLRGASSERCRCVPPSTASSISPSPTPPSECNSDAHWPDFKPFRTWWLTWQRKLPSPEQRPKQH